MAVLQATNVSGNITANGGVFPQGNNHTGWYRMYHCVDADSTAECNPTYSCGWIHVRTPYPATNAAGGIGWNPNIVECVGFHTYDGGWTHDFKAIVNNSGYSDNTWYGSQVRVNKGTDTGADAPVIYQSTNTYGNYKRVCIAMRKVGCCCVGWFWIRFWNNVGYRIDYPWATAARNSNTAYF